MAIIRELNGIKPKIGRNCFIAETAVLIGDVTIGDDCTIWYGAVLRGDVGPIIVGNRCNIQDNAVLHTTYNCSKVVLGDDSSVGHLAQIHGGIVGSCVLVGMGAIIMDNARVADGTIIAAGAVVLAGKQLDAGTYAGIPAKLVKEGSEETTARALKNAQGYLKYKEWYLGPDYKECAAEENLASDSSCE
ncbi:MAG: gamma carbonic anhydrase family protein [Bacteroidales bacterium]|nr:gamma carbonic anhydrase family protein [Bacteroidales bacterium]